MKWYISITIHFQCLVFISVWHNFSSSIFLYQVFWHLTQSIFSWPWPGHVAPVYFEKWPKLVFYPLHMVSGLNLPNLRFPKVLDCLRKFSVFVLKWPYICYYVICTTVPFTYWSFISLICTIKNIYITS